MDLGNFLVVIHVIDIKDACPVKQTVYDASCF